MSTRDVVCGVLLGLTVFATQASAQSSAQSADDWQFEFVPYLWGSGFDGEVGVGARTANVDASFSNILSHLHFAAMGRAEAQRGRLLAMTDAFYTDLRGQKATPGPLFSSVDPRQKMFILTPAAGYRLRETERGSIDVVGGIRLWRMRTELQFQPGLLPATNVEGSRTWVDAIGGVRARTALWGDWWAGAHADLGAGGSDFTYQVIGTAGLDIQQRYALTFGYRVLGVDYNRDSFLMDTTMTGPMVGFSFRFPGE